MGRRPFFRIRASQSQRWRGISDDEGGQAVTQEKGPHRPFGVRLETRLRGGTEGSLIPFSQITRRNWPRKGNALRSCSEERPSEVGSGSPRTHGRLKRPPECWRLSPMNKRTGAPKNRTGMIFSFSEDRTPSLFSFETPDDPAERKTINSAGSSRGLAASRAGGWVGRRGARVAKG